MQSLTYKIAAGLKNKAPDHPASIEELHFTLEAIFNTVSTIVVALLIAICTGKVSETIIVMQAFAFLRVVSGGIHLKYGWACTFATSIGANIMAFIQYPDIAIYVLTSISIVLALIYAPSRIDQQTRIPVKYFPLLKWVSVLIIASNFIVMSPYVTSAFFIQAILLVRIERR